MWNQETAGIDDVVGGSGKAETLRGSEEGEGSCRGCGNKQAWRTVLSWGQEGRLPSQQVDTSPGLPLSSCVTLGWFICLSQP